MPTDDDRRFADLARKEGLLSAEAVEEALRAQSAAEAVGVRKSLAEILVRKRLLSLAQVDFLRGGRGAPPEARRDLPDRIGPYAIRSVLGRGAMGVVYRAARDGAGDVALKVLSADLAASADSLERFLREGQAARRLHDPRVVRVLDQGEADGRHYIAMEVVEGESLESLLARTRTLPEKEALRIVREVALALDHARSKNLVHRDVKPSNILLAAAGRVKLADFGLAKEVNATSITLTGVALGTPHYISPEQARGDRQVDIRSDLYSLGATLYRMVTGEVPFPGTSAAVILAKHLTEALPSPKERNPGLSDACCRILERMMAKDRLDRYPDPAALVRDIDLAFAGKEPATERLAPGRSVILPAPAAAGALRPGRLAAILEACGTGLGVALLGRLLLWASGSAASPAIFVPPLAAAVGGHWLLRGGRLWRGAARAPSAPRLVLEFWAVAVALLALPLVPGGPPPAPPPPPPPALRTEVLVEAERAKVLAQFEDFAGALRALEEMERGGSLSSAERSHLAETRARIRRQEDEARRQRDLARQAEQARFDALAREAEDAFRKGDPDGALERYEFIRSSVSGIRDPALLERARVRFFEILGPLARSAAPPAPTRDEVLAALRRPTAPSDSFVAATHGALARVLPEIRKAALDGSSAAGAAQRARTDLEALVSAAPPERRESAAALRDAALSALALPGRLATGPPGTRPPPREPSSAERMRRLLAAVRTPAEGFLVAAALDASPPEGASAARLLASLPAGLASLLRAVLEQESLAPYEASHRTDDASLLRVPAAFFVFLQDERRRQTLLALRRGARPKTP